MLTRSNEYLLEEALGINKLKKEYFNFVLLVLLLNILRLLIVRYSYHYQILALQQVGHPTWYNPEVYKWIYIERLFNL